MTETDDGLEWLIDAVHDVHDGDSLRAFLRRTTRADDYRLRDDYTDPAREPDGEALRLAWVDTPERRKDPAGWLQAGDDARWWVEHRLAAGDQLRARTFGRGGFDRTLADVYVLRDAGDGTTVRDSLSQWLMIVKGWPPYVRGQ